MKKVLVIIIFNVFVLALYSQKTEFTLTLKDGNVVTGEAKVSSLLLTTDFGKLTIPIKNVTSIELGLHRDDSKKFEVINLAKQLLNSSEEMRSKAYSSLVALNPSSIPVLEDIIYEGTYEPSSFNDYTLSSALNELKVMHNVSSHYKTKDVAFIDYEYNMGGKYEFNEIELKTEYGTLKIPREKIEKIDVMYFDANSDGMKSFKLFAATHISSNQNGGWLKTGVMVKNGQNIKITANGEVTLASLSNNTYKPDGASKSISATDFNAPINSSNLSYGNVVFKIGDNGVQTKAGANYTGRANATGMLYISIYETVYNASNSGFYIAKIKVD